MPSNSLEFRSKNINITNRLLASLIKEASTNGLSYALTDTELRGFTARISPTGRVTWLASKSIGRGKGSTQRVVVGHYPGMSLADARIEVGAIISRLAKGEDVMSSVRGAKAAKVERMLCPTIKQAVADYLDTRTNADTRYEIEVRQLMERQVIPELGASTRLNEVSKADIRSLIKKRRDAGRHVAARNLYAQLRPFFAWCVEEEYISSSPCVGITAPPPADARQHKLHDAELKALWSATSDDSCPNILGPYFRVLMLTAQRRTEVASIQWQEVNLDRAEWIIPGSKTKNGREHLVPLSPLVLSILRSLPKRKPHEYVFGKYADAPVSGFSKAKREIEAVMLAKLKESDPDASLTDRSAIMRPWRIHDLRRTGASAMSGLKVPPHIIEAVLNHTPPGIQGVYQVWELHRYREEKRSALDAWGSYVSFLVSIGNWNSELFRFEISTRRLKGEHAT